MSQITSITPVETIEGGPAFTLTVKGSGFTTQSRVMWDGNDLRTTSCVDDKELTADVDRSHLTRGTRTVTVTVDTPGQTPSNGATFTIHDGQLKQARVAIDYMATVLRGAATTRRGLEPRALTDRETEAHPLWITIVGRADAMSFDRYRAFINRVMCEKQNLEGGGPGSPPGSPPAGDGEDRRLVQSRLLDHLEPLKRHLYGIDAYELLKVATETFLLLECGAAPPPRDSNSGRRLNTSSTVPNEYQHADEDPKVTWSAIRGRLASYFGREKKSYIATVLASIAGGQRSIDLPYCDDGVLIRADLPCLLELIWSYWHEEGMLVQTLNAITLRFQNIRAANGRDPLGAMTIDPLRPLSHLLWGYLQDEQHRLTLGRRAYEYDHEYGLRLIGRAVPALRPADSRTRFVGAFHTLLNRCAVYFQEATDLTVTPDPFGILTALREVHLLLAEGAHNQFRDLPWTARVEMLIQQWLLARPEVREFLRGRPMMPYSQPWMGAADAMRKLQGWGDTSVAHFHDLAVHGERLLLSIRWGNWTQLAEDDARGWAHFFRNDIRNYIHAYRAVTSVDLYAPLSTGQVDATMPSVYLTARLQPSAIGALQAAPSVAMPSPGTARALRPGK